ncbi:MAG: S-methyl-5'-thioadenosine phosphorylase [Methanocellales archaeon]|nr:S-methyl-5'-thioadenosine phosphorylase [Methanocellales archaeon]
MRIAIIGGSGVYDIALVEPREDVIKTEYGAAKVMIGLLEGKEIVFLARHGKGHTIPPHKINHRANIAALKAMDIKRIIGTTAVGSINPDMKAGDFVLLDQFLDFTKQPMTFHDEEVAHIDVTNPYCPELRESIMKAARALKMSLHEKGTYVCVEGPRFETSAEIRMFALLGGDVVGMTAAKECILAREMGICYAAIAMVANPAAGISHEKPIIRQIISFVGDKQKELNKLLMKSVALLPEERSCACGEAPDRAYIR